MKKGFLVSFTIISSIVIFISCSKSNTDEPSINCEAVPKSFATDVNPIIQTFCNQPNCHNTGSTNGPGALTNYSEVFDARARIKPQVATGLMPQNTTLTTAQKNIIICWIDSGAPNN
jgi:hypothetical protein